MSAARIFGHWYEVVRCERCKRRVTNHQQFYAMVCPHCGLAADGTILRVDHGHARKSWEPAFLGLTRKNVAEEVEWNP